MPNIYNIYKFRASKFINIINIEIFITFINLIATGSWKCQIFIIFIDLIATGSRECQIFIFIIFGEICKYYKYLQF